MHKTSCGGDWWQLGTYEAGPAKTLGSFQATPGWEDTFAQKRMDQGKFYASKDNEYPTKAGGTRRINWGWAQVAPASAQTLPRHITFNAAARTLQQAPIAELEALRGAAAVDVRSTSVKAGAAKALGAAAGVVKQSELLVAFDVPSTAATFGVTIGKSGAAPSGVPVSTFMPKTDMPGGDYSVTHHPAGTDAKVCEQACLADAKCQAWTYVIRGQPSGSGDCCLKDSQPCPSTSGAAAQCTSGARANATLPQCGGGGGDSTSCTVAFTPATNASAPFNEVPVTCGGFKDTLRLLPTETTVELRVYTDWTFTEAFFQNGRVAMTIAAGADDSADVSLTSDADVTVASATLYPLKSIWTTPDAVRKAPRVYN